MHRRRVHARDVVIGIHPEYGEHCPVEAGPLHARNPQMRRGTGLISAHSARDMRRLQVQGYGQTDGVDVSIPALYFRFPAFICSSVEVNLAGDGIGEVNPARRWMEHRE